MFPNANNDFILPFNIPFFAFSIPVCNILLYFSFFIFYFLFFIFILAFIVYRSIKCSILPSLKITETPLKSVKRCGGMCTRIRNPPPLGPHTTKCKSKCNCTQHPLYSPNIKQLNVPLSCTSTSYNEKLSGQNRTANGLFVVKI